MGLAVPACPLQQRGPAQGQLILAPVGSLSSGRIRPSDGGYWSELWRQPFDNFSALTSGWGISRLEGQCPTLAIRRGDAECRRMAKRAEASGSNGWGGLRSDHRQNALKCLWLRLQNSTPSNIKPAPIKFGGTLNCRAYSVGLALVAMV